MNDENRTMNSNRKILIIVLIILAFATILFIAFTPSHAIMSKDVTSANAIEIKVSNTSPSGTEDTVTYIGDALINLAKTDTVNLAYDGTEDNNLRYVGKDPNNYITFNNELWRIVGVFTNVSDGTNKETRVKLVKAEPLVDYKFGVSDTNDFGTTTLATTLNNDYLSKLTLDSQNYIDNAVWNTAGKDLTDPNTAQAFYTANNVYTGSNANFTGKVGLLTAADYGYSTAGGATANRDSCLNANLNTWNASSDCYANSYLYNSTSPLITLTPRSDVNTSLYAVDMTGNVSSINLTDSTITYSVYPSVYLKTDVSVKSGTGTNTDPYVLK